MPQLQQGNFELGRRIKCLQSRRKHAAACFGRVSMQAIFWSYMAVCSVCQKRKVISCMQSSCIACHDNHRNLFHIEASAQFDDAEALLQAWVSRYWLKIEHLKFCVLDNSKLTNCRLESTYYICKGSAKMSPSNALNDACVEPKDGSWQSIHLRKKCKWTTMRK